jgi:hypothetical protein
LHLYGHIISISSEDGWGHRVHSRRGSSFGVGGDHLTHLLFFFGVIEDDNVVVAGRPKDPTIEASLDEEEELLPKVHKGLRPLFFSIVNK